MENCIFTNNISRELGQTEHSVNNTLQLLEDGCTIPFISRYRKERTGGLDEVQISAINELYEKLKDISKRKETILKTILEQDKLTPELQKRIENSWNATELEDIYLPYKPKRRTRAQIAREQGLEPLANIMLLQREHNIRQCAQRFVHGDIKNTDLAIKGAQDIIAEIVSENEQSRQMVRNAFRREAIIVSKVIKSKTETEEALKFSDYFDWKEPLKRCPAHRLLAMRRGENDGFLRVSIQINDDDCIKRLISHYVRTSNECGKLVSEAVEDGYKRLILPSIETEYSSLSKEKADTEAIAVFIENLRQLLLSPPLGQKRVMGIDPGYRTGCKIVCLDNQGNLLHNETIFPHPPVSKQQQSTSQLLSMISKYHIEAIAIGNGTASRETKYFVEQSIQTISENPELYIVSEDGASIYSASKIAREEFPDYDVTVRGAVSIGRRLMDPLAELVKIDSKSIGVGQYQHDVDQSRLKKSLDQTVVSCVNSVGVNLNTASVHLLTYVSGLGASLANNIVEYRREHGPFTSREQIKKVSRIGASAYEQCAGFLRIPNATNPLDNTAVHPERYKIVEQMAKDLKCTVKDLIENQSMRKQIDINKYVSKDVGLPTLTDIMQELDKPGRDPREKVEVFEFDRNVNTPDDLQEGMVLPGIVTNITNFGAFVDIGVHQDGLVHISQLSDKFINDPTQVVKLHQHVRVKVLEVDRKRNRISLSMKNIK